MKKLFNCNVMHVALTSTRVSIVLAGIFSFTLAQSPWTQKVGNMPTGR